MPDSKPETPERQEAPPQDLAEVETQIREGSYEMPLKNEFLPPPLAMFAALQGEAPEIALEEPHRPPPVGCWGLKGVQRDGQRVAAIVVSSAAYDRCDALSDHFTETARLRGNRYGKASPAAAWRTMTPQIIGIAQKYLQKDPDMPVREALRDAVYLLELECTQFRPSLAKGVFQFFEAKRILDVAAGWGDRALAAAAAGVESYHGVDPNPDLATGYRQIQEMCAGVSKTELTFSSCPFEEFETALRFDMVFASPPFFDKETYTDDPAQSIVKFPTFEGWLDGWFCPLLDKATGLLSPGGVLVVYMVDDHRVRICGRMTAHLRGVPGMEHVGILPWRLSNRRGHYPLWVWKKK